MTRGKPIALATLLWVGALGWVWTASSLPATSSVMHAAAKPHDHDNLDRDLAAVLSAAGFTGNIEATLEQRLGRPLKPKLVDLGRFLFFDNILGLRGDNSCAGCHAPAFGFGDSQSIAIGTQNNGIVGPGTTGRKGPRNQRKAPIVTNSAFIPKLMLNGRFVAPCGDPFDNSCGFEFPLPEGTTRFPPGDDGFPTLLSAQGHAPSTELVEMAGFTGAKTNPLIDPIFDQFDDGQGTALPHDVDGDGFLNEDIRNVVLGKIRNTKGYVKLFREVFGSRRARHITFAMVGQALSEFQTSLTLANAPIDRFAQGHSNAMTDAQKRGALLFFGKARCVECHGVAGPSNEMFSDFQNWVLAVPQLAPVFGVGTGNVVFDGPNKDEDFGRQQISGDPADRYKFRTSPLRNVAVQPAFFHDGAFTRLEDAVRHHLNVGRSARNYDPVRAGVDTDLRRVGPIEPILQRLDERLKRPIDLTSREFRDLVTFVRDGLLDPRAKPEHLCRLVPDSVPSGMPVLAFQGCP